VAVGETETAAPLVAGRLPGVIMPVPPENVAVRFEDWPALMVEGLATKLEMVGVTGFTVTVTVCVTAVPVAGVTVRV